MDAQAFALGMAELAVAAIVVAVWAVVRRVRGRALSPTVALVGAFGIATVAMLGSLTFSEVYNFTPCRLCWYQRFAMYPLSLLLGASLVRRDLRVRWLAIPMALVGAGISTWHVLIQNVPTLEGSTSCDPTAPCTVIWVQPLGIFSIPAMALAGFVAIIALLAAASDSSEVDDDLDTDTPPVDTDRTLEPEHA